MNFKKVLVIGALVSAVAIANAKLPHNAYITRPTPSKEAFLKLVNNDPVVTDRYMRHFAMNKEELNAYFSTLHLGKLTQGGLYTVYNVPKTTGVLRSRLLKMKQGEPVWMDQYNQPIMVVVCGNPMTRGPRNPIAASSTEAEISDEPVSIVRPTDETLVAQATPAMDTPDLELASQPAMPIAQENPTVVPPVVQNAAVNRNGLGIIAAAIPFIAISRTGDTVKHPPVPEPATFVAMGLGASALVARRRKKA